MTPVDQTLFHTALLDAQAPVPDGLTDGAGRPAGRRFNVYRNNVAASLTDALHTAFPSVSSLIGKVNMDGLAGLYLRAHPPETPMMMQYGAQFPDFIATLSQLSHLPYLPDMARLDLAMRHAYHAADATAIAADELAALPPDDLLRARVTLAPSLRVIRSQWPIHAIWQVTRTPDAPKPEPVAQDILITRPDFDPTIDLLPIGGADFLAALAQGAPLGTAIDAAPDAFDPGPVIAMLLHGQALTSLNLNEVTA